MRPLNLSALAKRKECPVCYETLRNYCKFHGLPHTKITGRIYVELDVWTKWFRSFTKTNIMSEKVIERTISHEVDSFVDGLL